MLSQVNTLMKAVDIVKAKQWYQIHRSLSKSVPLTSCGGREVKGLVKKMSTHIGNKRHKSWVELQRKSNNNVAKSKQGNTA